MRRHRGSDQHSGFVVPPPTDCSQASTRRVIHALRRVDHFPVRPSLPFRRFLLCGDVMVFRPFLMRVLPKGFHRIRHCGLLASGTKTGTIARARELIAAAAPAQTAHKPQAPNSAAATDKPTQACPCCGGRMSIIETFERGSTPRYRPPPPTAIRIDTS